MSVTTPSIGSGAPAASDHNAVRYLGPCASYATIPTIVMKTLGAPHRDCECGEESQKLPVEDATSAVRHCNRQPVLCRRSKICYMARPIFDDCSLVTGEA